MQDSYLKMALLLQSRRWPARPLHLAFRVLDAALRRNARMRGPTQDRSGIKISGGFTESQFAEVDEFHSLPAQFFLF
jgi:hypothetical protein